MEVTDEVLEAGVKALREERFTYRPPRDSLMVRLARLYVQRGKWGLRAVVALTLLTILWLGYLLQQQMDSLYSSMKPWSICSSL